MSKYIKYKGGIYFVINNILTEKYVLSTHFKEKTDSSFYSYSDFYARDFEYDEIEEMYSVEFFVKYRDTSLTVKERAQNLKKWLEKGEYISESTLDSVFGHKWSVEGGNAEKNEVRIELNTDSLSEDWVMFERGFCEKIVSAYDCEGLFARYVYSVLNGKKLPQEEITETALFPEEFKAERLKYRNSNI